jgi:uncharacterized membrane protein YedE/YeeE
MVSDITQALIGGVIIGLASTLLLWANGRIAGISGILGGVLNPKSGDVTWRVVFVIGLMLGSIVFSIFQGPLQPTMQASTPVLIAAGLIVGFGTRLGSGCTSGHGVCGIARLSSRSIVATIIFMTFGVITVFITRHIIGA